MSESRKNSPQENSKVSKKAKSVGEMSPELREVYEQLRELVTQSDTQDADAQYRIGCVVRDVQDAPGKYGAGSVKRLAQGKHPVQPRVSATEEHGTVAA
ncbi:hypothetical protein [Archangium lipolyticum]|uniref:hypothetical protein n=1 Tax=Archangium lipolyticum TaxID=2970465 RepID=UPI00214A737E|nr:hypothetical protein [Archangium lipolyticum]